MGVKRKYDGMFLDKKAKCLCGMVGWLCENNSIYDDNGEPLCWGQAEWYTIVPNDTPTLNFEQKQIIKKENERKQKENWSNYQI